ncbi:TetR/AcrR family transcriptional regulator [Spirillospora sp. CA-294931]|uniref:TetR/AcrR family transcriptional regulator n=1 Tax=Spirillospora sp. CA-294931 TaxID=3240042 RepID=UPI003D8AD312
MDGQRPEEQEDGRRRAPFRRLSSDRRREEIITAAVEVFGSHPEDAVSIDAIAQAAGTSRSSLYRYFDSRGEIYGAAVHRVGNELIHRLRTVPPGAPSARLSAQISIYFDFLERFEVGYAALLGRGERPSAPEAGFEAAQHVRDQICVMTCETLEVRDPSPLMATTVRSWIAAVEWAGTEWLRTREPSRREVEWLVCGHIAVMLIGASPLDPTVAERVAWLVEVEPVDSMFGHLIRGIAGTVDKRTLANLARFLSYEP